MQRSVLIIDDDVQMVQELSHLFKARWISVLTATSGAASLGIADHDTYDVALVDFRLPDCNGIELITQLRKRRPESAYVLVTAYASLESAIKSVHSGIAEYIAKPFDPEDLLRVIERGFAAKDDASQSIEHRRKIAEEKRLLEKKLSALIKLNEIYLGREQEMARLKSEVNGLLKELNRDIKYKDEEL